MTFRDYIRKRRITDTPYGDFVRDAKADSSFPDVRTWEQLRGYLYNRNACREAVSAGKVVWRQYLEYKE